MGINAESDLQVARQHNRQLLLLSCVGNMAQVSAHRESTRLVRLIICPLTLRVLYFTSTMHTMCDIALFMLCQVPTYAQYL